MINGGLAAGDQERMPNAIFSRGDRWVALGDSITHTGLYPRFLELFLITRFPSQELVMINAGIGGDSATGALTRLDWDVFDENPTVVSIMFGMNDVDRRLYTDAEAEHPDHTKRSERIARYTENLRSIVEKILSTGVRVILITPSPTDDTMVSDPPMKSRVNEGLTRCAVIVRSLGEEFKLPTIDFHEPMLALNQALQESDPSATLIGRDRVHPGPVGHLALAYLFLREIFENSTVSSVVIDAKEPGKAISKNATLRDLEIAPGSVRFSMHAKALPFPVPENAMDALGIVPFIKDFNSEYLEIRALPAGTYELCIDGISVGAYSSEELESGINLATADTPQMRQARRVAEILEKKHAIDAVLGDIAFCELRLWSPRQFPVRSDEMVELIEEAITVESALSDPRDSVLRRYRNYSKNKAMEADLRLQRDELSALVTDASFPIEHRYEILRIPEHPAN